MTPNSGDIISLILGGKLEIDSFLFHTTANGDRVGITEAEYERRYRRILEERYVQIFLKAVEEGLLPLEITSLPAEEQMGHTFGIALAVLRAEQNPEYDKFSKAERQAWLADHCAEHIEWYKTKDKRAEVINLFAPQ